MLLQHGRITRMNSIKRHHIRITGHIIRDLPGADLIPPPTELCRITPVKNDGNPDAIPLTQRIEKIRCPVIVLAALRNIQIAQTLQVEVPPLRIQRNGAYVTHGYWNIVIVPMYKLSHLILLLVDIDTALNHQPQGRLTP